MPCAIAEPVEQQRHCVWPGCTKQFTRNEGFRTEVLWITADGDVMGWVCPTHIVSHSKLLDRERRDWLSLECAVCGEPARQHIISTDHGVYGVGDGHDFVERGTDIQQAAD
jgi:hypothetical protein